MSQVNMLANAASASMVKQTDSFKMERKILKDTIKRFCPELSEGAVGALPVVDAINFVTALVFLEIQKEGGNVSIKALNHFYTHRYWSTLTHADNKLAYERLFKLCQLSANAQRKQMALLGILEKARTTTNLNSSHFTSLLGASPISPKEQGELANKLLVTATQSWELNAPFLMSRGNNLSQMDQLPTIMDIRVGNVRREARNANFARAKFIGLETRVFWQRISPMIHQLNLYVSHRLPMIATNVSALVGLDTPYLARLNTFQRQVMKAHTLASKLNTAVCEWQFNMAIMLGIYPQVHRVKNWLYRYFKELGSCMINFYSSAFPEFEQKDIKKDDPEISSLFKRRLELLTKLVGSSSSDTNNPDMRICNTAIEGFKKDVNQLLDPFSMKELLAQYELQQLEVRCFTMQESLKKYPWHVVREKEVTVLAFYELAEKTLEGLLSARKIFAKSEYDAMNVSGKHQLESNEVAGKLLTDMNLITHGCANNLYIYRCLFDSVVAVCQRNIDTSLKLASAKADRNLLVLQAEEDMLAKAALERTEQRKKKRETEEKNSVAAVVPSTVLPVPSVPTAVVTPLADIASSPFNTPASKLIFELRQCVAQFYKINLDHTSVRTISLQDLSATDQAKYNHLNALDSLTAALQIYENCRQTDKATAIRLILLWGYLVLEQAATIEFTASHPATLLLHDLTVLLDKIGIADASLWRQHVGQGTFFIRYPWNFKASGQSCPFALRHIREGNEKTVEEFNKHFHVWIEDLAKMELRVLSLRDSSGQAPLLTRIHSLIQSFQKCAARDQVPHADQQNTEIDLCQNALKIACEGFQKRLSAAQPLNKRMRKVLLNALVHVNNLKGALSLLSQFPQKRYLYLHLHFMLFSTQYCAENIGYFLSLQNGDTWRTHSLAHYSKIHHLADDLSAEQRRTLHFIDIGKGSEYYANLGDLSRNSPLHLLEELKIYAKEAFLMGEEAVPGQIQAPKSVSVLRSEILAWARKLVDLIAALTEKRVQ